MNFDTYRSLALRFENEARSNPSAYAFRVAGLAMLGYAYLVGITLIVLGLFGASVWLAATVSNGRAMWIKLALGMGCFALVMLRAFFVRFSLPEGVRLTRADAPRLFAMVDEVRRQIGAARVHEILLRDDFNAAMAQVPRLGLFGWHRNFLLIGLPLMEALTANQLRAVIAHELGHLSRQHSKFSGRVYCMRQAWSNLLTNLEQSGSQLTGLFTGFFKWYAPYFSAASFVLARHDEYVADAYATEVAGHTVARETLVRIQLVGRHAGRSVWPELWNAAAGEEAPEPGRYRRAVAALRGPLDREAAHRDFAEAMAAQAGYDNTHPSLAERLAAIERLPAPKSAVGVSPLEGACRGAAPESSAERYLGAAHDALADRIDAQWRERAAESWQQRHHSVREAQTRLEALGDRDETALTEDEAWAAIQSRIELNGLVPTAPEIERFVAARPMHNHANYLLGMAMLERSDEGGLEYLNQVMERDSTATPAVCSAAAEFLRGRGRATEADAYERRSWAYGEAWEMAGQERARLTRKTVLVPHGLDAQTIAAIRAALLAEPTVEQAYLARHQVEHLTDQPAYVLGLVLRHPWYKLKSNDADAKTAQRISEIPSLPPGTFMFALTGDLAWARKRVAAVADATLVSKADRRAGGAEEEAKAA